MPIFGVLALLLLSVPASAAAQTDHEAAAPVERAPPASEQPSATSVDRGLLTRFDATFTWGGLRTNDPRFAWRGQADFDLDIVDYGAGRVGFVARYEAVLGSERRRYDLNQGSYLFEASASIRTAPVEIMGVFQHWSRHTVDRENQPAVSWNTYGVRASRDWVARGNSGWAGTRVEGEVDIAKAMQQAFVDYRWVSHGRAKMTRPVSSSLAIIVEATGDVVGVDEATRGSSRVCGGRIEGALRIEGRVAALELYAGYERRIDAFPTDRYRVRAFIAGFRLTN